MAGVPARTVLAALLAGTFAGIPASASDKEVQVELTGRIEPSCKLARDSNRDFLLSISERPQLANRRLCDVAVRLPVNGVEECNLFERCLSGDD